MTGPEFFAAGFVAGAFTAVAVIAIAALLYVTEVQTSEEKHHAD